MENDQLVYACKCGCTTFFLYRDGKAGCPECDDRFSDIDVRFPPGIPVDEQPSAS